MSKKVLQDSIVLLLCFATLNSLAQEKCPSASTSIKPFFAGYPDCDSISAIEILGTRKLATDSCPTLSDNAFFAGYPGSRSLTVEELLTSGKLVTNANGYEIVSFKVGAAISFEGLTWCGEITNNGPDFITEVKNLIRRGKGYTYFIDAITVKNKAGQTFCLESFKLMIR